MTDRDRLVEIMARGTLQYRYGRLSDAMLKHDKEMIERALADAEREGFRFLGPDDGR